MLKAVTAYALKSQLGRILRDVRSNERFLIFRRNSPVAVLLSVQDYLKDHADGYDDLQDFLDTATEQADPQFQKSLRRSAQQMKRGRYLTHTQLKLALAGKKWR